MTSKRKIACVAFFASPAQKGLCLHRRHLPLVNELHIYDYCSLGDIGSLYLCAQSCRATIEHYLQKLRCLRCTPGRGAPFKRGLHLALKLCCSLRQLQFDSATAEDHAQMIQNNLLALIQRNKKTLQTLGGLDRHLSRDAAQRLPTCRALTTFSSSWVCELPVEAASKLLLRLLTPRHLPALASLRLVAHNPDLEEDGQDAAAPVSEKALTQILVRGWKLSLLFCVYTCCDARVSFDVAVSPERDLANGRGTG